MTGAALPVLTGWALDVGEGAGLTRRPEPATDRAATYRQVFSSREFRLMLSGISISTLGDLGRWGHALGTGQLLTPATQLARLIPNQASEAGGRAYLFALGSDHGWLGHEGSIPGFNTDVQYLPARNATIVVLANTDISNAQGHSPVSTIFSALAQVIDPAHAPAR